ncbi:hypothetical protein PG984_008482 [Apiospora sp. TS-2023a]
MADAASQTETERQSLRSLTDEHETALPREEKKQHPGGFREWTTEILSLVAAAACVGAMVGLIFAYDKKPQDEWSAPVTLNALVSVLSVVVKGSLLFSVCEALSQWKWLLFTKDHRPLIDFERVDRASRGPLGCVNILMRFWSGYRVLSLGTFVALLTITLDPFTQQIIHTRNEVVFTNFPPFKYNPDDGFLVYNNNFTGGDLSYVSNWVGNSRNGSYYWVKWSTTIPVAMESAIMYGLDKNLTTVRRQTGYRCPSADCRWPPYKSLAVCSECNTIPSSNLKPIEGNVTKLLQTYRGYYDSNVRGKRASGWHLPNGQFLANMEEHELSFGPDAMNYYDVDVLEMTAKSTGNPNNTITLQHRDNLLWAVSIMHLNNTKGDVLQVTWPGAPVLAHECGLYWCVNQYRSSMANNTYSESVEEVPAPRVRGLWDHDGDWPDESLEFHSSVTFNKPNNSLPGELRLCPSSSSSTNMDHCFSAPAGTIWAVNNHFRKLFTANVTTHNASAGLGPGPGQLANTAHILGGTMEPDDFKDLWNWKKQDLEGTFAALAYSMSNEVRASRDDHGHDQGLPMSVGRVAAIYDMQWGWMSWHCATLLLGAAFLYLTIVHTNKTATPVLKSHSLAILKHGSHLAQSMVGVQSGTDIDAWARINLAKIGDGPQPPRDLETHNEMGSHDQAQRPARSPGSNRSNPGIGALLYAKKIIN